jgi:hypothetical protein
MNRLYTIVKMIWQVLRRSPGEAVTIQVESGLGESREIEYYQLPGISAGPTPQDRAATIEMNGFRVAVASHNYRVGVEPQAGELILFSTNADGSASQAMVRLKPDGNIDLNGDGKTLVTHAELDTALQGLVDYINAHTHSGVSSGSSTSGPPSAPGTLDISAAEAATLRTDG